MINQVYSYHKAVIQAEGRVGQQAGVCTGCKACMYAQNFTRGASDGGLACCGLPCAAQKSCKCYCFMEMDEIRTGPITLEVYKKPPNYARTKEPSLLSVKPFYLHLYLTVETYEV